MRFGFITFALGALACASQPFAELALNPQFIEYNSLKQLSETVLGDGVRLMGPQLALMLGIADLLRLKYERHLGEALPSLQ
jgi:hypothetical protein